MSEQAAGKHLVCTFEEAEGLLHGREGCWTPGHVDEGALCLSFAAPEEAGREVSASDARDALARARDLQQVARLILDHEGEVEGVCLGGRNCGCLMSGRIAEPGHMVEKTHFEFCTHCGDCVDLCEFGARRMVEHELEVVGHRCHGCGLCAAMCPELCVRMVPRAG